MVMNGLLEQLILISGGLGLFLHGLAFGGQALREGLGDRARWFLSRLGNNRGLSFVLGMLLSLLTQSSTAATSMAVGLVDVGLLPLTSAVVTMIGASVGTTLVILALSLDLVRFSPLILLGAILLTRLGGRGIKRVGKVLLGFSLVLVGMLLLNQGVAPLSRTPFLQELLLAGRGQPLMVAFLAFFVTSLIQSNVPVLALTIALASTGTLSLETALPVIIGGHVGSSTTVLLAGFGTRLNARTLARATLFYKFGGALLALPLGQILLQGARFMGGSVGEQVAWLQVLFTVLNALVFLPMTSPLMGLSRRISGANAPSAIGDPLYLDPSSSTLPPLALSLLSKEMIRLALYLEELTLRCLRCSGREDKHRMESLQQGTVELAQACLEYLLSIPAPEVTSRLNREYASLSYSMAALRDLAKIATERIAPLCLTSENNAGPPLRERSEDWQRFVAPLEALVQDSLGALAVGTTDLAQRAQDRFTAYNSAEKEIRSHLLARGFHGDSKTEQNIWDFLSAANGLARACLELAHGESIYAYRDDRGDRNKDTSSPGRSREQ